MDQGSENADGDMSNSSIPGNTRWNPTKEQITLLEGLYKQGIRTPTAEQIQQITARLKVFGHIEGKNVFYWFQNHKARQRQKQKQENMAYFKSYFHKPSPLAVGFPPPNGPNVVCGPYYLPQSELGFYQQYTKVLHTVGIQRSPMPTYKGGLMLKEGSKQETLPLFPLEPTGVLQAARVSTNSSLASNSSTPSSSSEIDETCGDQPSFFDFFSGNGSYESD